MRSSEEPNAAATLDFPALPEGWIYRELGDLLQPNGLSYGIVQPGAGDPNGVPVLRVKNIRNGRVMTDDVLHVARDVEEGYRRTRLSGGEVLLTLVGSVGEVAVAPSFVEGWNVARAIAVIRVEDGVASSWMKLCLSSTLAQQFMHVWQTTTVQATLNLRDVRRLPIILPPVREREAIAGLIGALDDKIAVNDRIIGVVHDLGDACFQDGNSLASHRRALGELVANKALAFGDGYRTKRSEHGKPGLPILRVAEVMNGRIEPDFADFVADDYRSAMGGKISQAGDVILTTKGTVGRVAAITAKDPSFVYSPQLCYFRALPDSPISSSYVYFWLRSKDFWRQAVMLKSQTDMADYLSLTDIRNLDIPMPAPESNKHRLPTLTDLLAQISAFHEENKALAELRDTLLPKLMSGEIHVRDAENAVEDVT